MAAHSSLNFTSHRPWPIPQEPWTWRQRWLELLFAHWPIDAEQLRPHIPDGLEIDQFDGTAYVAVVPFRMEGVMRRPLPDLPWISAFPELNVRTYVTHNGKPGVYFLSLDATNPLAIWAARTFFYLPYRRARMRVQRNAARITYASQRTSKEAELRGWYAPNCDPFESTPGTIEHWLTERYCLFANNKRGRISCTEVHHAPWPLQTAQADFSSNSMLTANGLPCDGPPALLHYADSIDVVVWSPEWVT